MFFTSHTQTLSLKNDWPCFNLSLNHRNSVLHNSYNSNMWVHHTGVDNTNMWVKAPWYFQNVMCGLPINTERSVAYI